jgi:hypothetical protein
MVGFEPTTPWFRTRYANQAAPHPEEALPLGLEPRTYRLTAGCAAVAPQEIEAGGLGLEPRLRGSEPRVLPDYTNLHRVRPRGYTAPTGRRSTISHVCDTCTRRHQGARTTALNLALPTSPEGGTRDSTLNRSDRPGRHWDSTNPRRSCGPFPVRPLGPVSFERR